MSVSILEALQNSDYNIQNNGSLGLMIAKGQLHNAVTLLEKGYSLSDEIEPLLEQFGDVEAVPEGGITKRAADECQSHAWRASHTGFKFCPDCGGSLSTHR